MELFVRLTISGDQLAGISAGALPQTMNYADELNPLLFRDLSPREHDVLEYVAAGFSNNQIGRALGLSPLTARTHISALSDAVGHAQRSRLAALAILSGAVTAERILEIWRAERYPHVK